MLISETKQSERDPKVDPRVKRTRKLLQQAFKELMAEKPFRDITVQDIADRAEVNRATFYAHFEDKYALLGYMVRDDLQDELDKYLPNNPPLTLANLRLLAVVVSDFMTKFGGQCTPASPDHLHIVMQVQQYLNQLLLEWLSKGDSKAASSAKNSTTRSGPGSAPTATPATVAMTLSWIIYGAARQAAMATPHGSTEQVAAQAIDEAIVFLTPSLQGYFG